MICESNTYFLGKVQANRTIGIANKITSASSFISFF